MRLGQLFRGDGYKEQTTNVVQGKSVQGTDFNRQIHSLVPGQTIHGEIVSKSENDVQIKLADDSLLQAKVDAGVHLEEGQQVTFEVKNNGNTLTLSPLFTNTASDANVLIALDMAGLPVNEDSVEMTEQLMKTGLPIHRNMLHQVYREVKSYPQNSISDIVNLHKLNLQVNNSNLEQMSAYRNLKHQLIEGMQTVFDELPEVMNQVIERGDAKQTLSFFGNLIQLVQNSASTMSESGLTPAEDGIEEWKIFVDRDSLNKQQGPIKQEGIVSRENLENQEGLVKQEGLTNQEGLAKQEGLVSQEGLANQEGLTNQEGLLNQKGLMNQEGLANQESLMNQDGLKNQQSTLNTEIPVSLESLAGQKDKMMLQEMVNPESPVHSEKLLKLFSQKEFRTELLSFLKQQWTVFPEEVSQPKRIQELYRMLERQFKELADILENSGNKETNAYKTVTSLSQNVDFMNQLNQVYTYIQLPLKLQESETHGELYVYTNKRNLAERKGEISALLHLDMKSLGPLDVYVKLNESKVSTKFYVADEDVLNFIEDHLEMLTRRLAQKGYDCKVSSSIRGVEKENTTGLQPLLRVTRGDMLTKYAFDMRA